MELGLAYLACNYNSKTGEKYICEYQIDKIEPATFSMEEI